MKIHTYGTLTPNEDSTITTTAITQHNSLLQEQLNVHLPLMAVNKLPHLTVRKLQQQQKQKKKKKKKKGRLDTTSRGGLARLSFYSEVHVIQNRLKGGARQEGANRYLHARTRLVPGSLCP